MGSKGLKAIVIDDADAPGVAIANPDAFKKAAKEFTQMLMDHPVTGQGLPTYGTAVLVNILNEAGGLPTRNFTYGRFDGTNKISGEAIFETINQRKGKTTHACHPGCVMLCSQIYNDKDGNYLTAGFEYETIWAFGSNCTIDNLDVIATMDRLCDDIGLLKEVGAGSPLGRIVGSGAAAAGQAFGVSKVPVVKRQAIPAYDPRTVKGIGVTFATSTMGADHTAGYSVATKILNVGRSLDPLMPEGQVDLSRNLQIATAAVDSTGLCLFVAFCVLDNPNALPAVIDMINAQYGLTLNGNDIIALGQSILKIERAFNIAAGFGPGDDRLPEFFEQEELAPYKTKFDVQKEELDQLFNF